MSTYLFRAILLAVICCSPGFAIAFTQPEQVDRGAIDQLSKYGARIATDRAGHWVAVYSGLQQHSRSDEDIYVVRSTDRGKTWSVQKLLNSNSDSKNYNEHPDLATDGNGTRVCVWDVTKNFESVIWSSVSQDNGLTWSDAVRVTPYEEHGRNWFPSLAVTNDGNWVVVWETNHKPDGQASEDGDLDIGVSTSTNGSTWSPTRLLNSAADLDAHFNDYRPHITTDGNGSWVCTWNSGYNPDLVDRNDVDVFFARSANNGQTWTEQALIDPLQGDEDESNLDYRSWSAADAAGNFVLVWNSAGGIVGSRSDDGGVTWQPTELISLLHPGLDPIVATDGNGKWIVTWDGWMRISDNSGLGWKWETAAPFAFTTLVSDGHNHWAGMSSINADIYFTVSRRVKPLTVIRPMRGDGWWWNTSFAIEWESKKGRVGPDVTLQLFRYGTFVENIADSTENDGRFSWLVPSDLPTGGGYKVRIESKTDPAKSDMSDGTFSIRRKR